MVEETEIVVAAKDRAESLLASAQDDANAIKDEADTYVDGRLATLEVVLTKTMDAITRGRARLAGEKDASGLDGIVEE